MIVYREERSAYADGGSRWQLVPIGVFQMSGEVLLPRAGDMIEYSADFMADDKKGAPEIKMATVESVIFTKSGQINGLVVRPTNLQWLRFHDPRFDATVPCTIVLLDEKPAKIPRK